jgi:hypothetical protein
VWPLQLLSIHPFEKAHLHELVTETEFKATPSENSNQSLLSNLWLDARGVATKSWKITIKG